MMLADHYPGDSPRVLEGLSLIRKQPDSTVLRDFDQIDLY